MCATKKRTSRPESAPTVETSHGGTPVGSDPHPLGPVRNLPERQVDQAIGAWHFHGEQVANRAVAPAAQAPLGGRSAGGDLERRAHPAVAAGFQRPRRPAGQFPGAQGHQRDDDALATRLFLRLLHDLTAAACRHPGAAGQGDAERDGQRSQRPAGAGPLPAPTAAGPEATPQFGHRRPTAVRTRHFGQMGLWHSLHRSRVSTPSRGHVTSSVCPPFESIRRLLSRRSRPPASRAERPVSWCGRRSPVARRPCRRGPRPARCGGRAGRCRRWPTPARRSRRAR